MQGTQNNLCTIWIRANGLKAHILEGNARQRYLEIKAAMANKIASQLQLVINAKKKITSWYLKVTDCCAFQYCGWKGIQESKLDKKTTPSISKYILQGKINPWPYFNFPTVYRGVNTYILEYGV